MEKTTLYIPSDVHRGLKEAAKREGRSLSELVREALATYLSQKRRPVPQSIGLGHDPELTGRDSEAWLRTHWRKRR